jgi:hypothetical protein
MLMKVLQMPLSLGRSTVPKRGPKAFIRTVTPSGAAGLRFTEWLFLAVFGLAYLFAISTPVFSIKLYLTSIGHFPLILLGPILILQVVGLILNRSMLKGEEIIATTWPLVILALFALVGSALAKWEYSINDTYLTFGIYLLLLPLYVAMVPGVYIRARRWALSIAGIWIVFSLAAFIGELAHFGGSEALHEIEYLVICGFFIMYKISRSIAIKVLALICLVAATALNQKLTGYLVALLAMFYLLFGTGWGLLPRKWRGLYGIVAGVCSLLLITALTLLYFEYRTFLPSGNVDVRLAQYEAALRQFLQSPLWGSGFTDSSGEAYAESFRKLYIPTHSDILDMLKHGGLIALSLLLFGYWKIFDLMNKAIAATRDDRMLNAYFVAVRFFQLTALLTFSINPILLKSAFLIVIWGNLGLAAGIALVAVRQAESGAAAA